MSAPTWTNAAITAAPTWTPGTQTAAPTWTTTDKNAATLYDDGNIPYDSAEFNYEGEATTVWTATAQS